MHGLIREEGRHPAREANMQQGLVEGPSVPDNERVVHLFTRNGKV